MRFIFILFAVATLFGCKLQENVLPGQFIDPVQIITNVKIFTGNQVLENTNFVFNESNIVAITRDIKSYANVQHIDGTNKTIIPPLGNAHVHLWSPDSLKNSLSAGIFANFDLHNTDHTANLIRTFKDSINYSSFYSANAAATVPGGHGTQFGIPVPTINDSISPEQFVQDRIHAGADFIKVIKEPLYNTLTEEQTLRVINEAHKNDVLAVGHSHNIDNTIILVDQDIDGIVHSWFDKEALQEDLQKMKESEVFLIPTLLVTKKVLELGKFQGWADKVLNIDGVLAEVKRAHDIGIPILCGTDSPNFGINYTNSLFEEMELLSEAGLSNEEVLKAATVNIFTSFGIDNFAAIKPGGLANFILVDGEPLLQISEIRKSKTIYKNGRVISKEPTTMN